MEISGARRRPGRPLSFDRDAALRQAMLAFWRHGYETTSIAELTTAMGVTAPSLYAAFGDKQQLFLAAAQLYAGDPQAVAEAIAAAPCAYAAARDLLTSAAHAYTGDDTPSGCLLASATASGSSASAEVQNAVAAIRRHVQTCLQDRMQRDVAEGLVARDVDAAAFAGVAMATLQGMSVLARDGATRAELLAIVGMAVSPWSVPSEPRA